jgi:TolB-like protein/DNA-binding winged helix-turn-helix (wHTH) protein
MLTNPRTPQVFRFGPFELDLRSGELRKRGVRLALQEQPLRILVALLERPGEIVSREDLCRRLWPLGTFVDFEHSLNAAMRRLRVTLGDTAETPRFIETVHRRGYRFLAWSGENSGFRAQGPGKNVHVARLAVMSFASLNGEFLASRFSEGLTEETVTQVARLCPVQVAVLARASVLNADYLLEGSIRREGDRVRIIAHLIEAHGQTHLWAATYDRVIADVLTVQTEVADEIAKAVVCVLSELTAVNAQQPPLSREAAS